MFENEQLLYDIHLLTLELIGHTYDIKESTGKYCQIGFVQKMYATTIKYLAIFNCPFDNTITPPYTMPVFWHDIHAIELQLRRLIIFYLAGLHKEYETEKAINCLYLILSFLSNMCVALEVTFENLRTLSINGEEPLVIDKTKLPTVKRLLNKYSRPGRPTDAQRSTALITSEGKPVLKPIQEYRRRKSGPRSKTNQTKYIKTLAKYTNIPYDELVALRKVVRLRNKELKNVRM